MRTTAAFSDRSGSCSRASSTSLTARSRNSLGYFLGAGICPPFCGIRASSKPGAVQIVWHLLHDNTGYAELGTDYFDKRNDADARQRYLVRELEKLGNTVILEPAA